MKSLILPVADNMFLSSHATKSLVMYVFNFPFPPPGFGVVHLPSMILLSFIQQVETVLTCTVVDLREAQGKYAIFISLYRLQMKLAF